MSYKNLYEEKLNSKNLSFVLTRDENEIIRKNIIINRIIILGIFLHFVFIVLFIYNMKGELLIPSLVTMFFYLPISITRYGIFCFFKLEKIVNTLLYPANKYELQEALKFFTNNIRNHIYNKDVASIFGWYYQSSLGRLYACNDLLESMEDKEEERYKNERAQRHKKLFNAYSNLMEG